MCGFIFGALFQYVSVFMPIAYSFDTYRFVILFESECVMPPALLFLFKIALAIIVFCGSNKNFKSVFFCGKHH